METQQNLLLSAMPRDSYGRLERHMRLVELQDGEVLNRPGQVIEFVHFPLSCLISVTVTMADGNTSEACVVGSREMVGINAFMGGSETTQTEYITRVPGQAVRILAKPLLDEFDSHKLLRDLLLRYTQAYIAQLSQNVACNRQHDLTQRLARWLLESRARLHSDDLHLTHEFVSQMLGVRRAGVSEGLAALQERGVIESGRKSIKIVDIKGIMEASCECYEVIREEYDRLLGTRRKDRAGADSHGGQAAEHEA